MTRLLVMGTSDHGTIVVVEDDVHIADLLDMTLRQAGYRVIQATTGEAGLAAVEREQLASLVEWSESLSLLRARAMRLLGEQPA